MFERFYINTYDPDLYIARRSGHRSRSTHFILPLKVEPVLSDFPLAALPALLQVDTRSAEHWHTAACAIARVFRRVSDQKSSKFIGIANFFTRNRVIISENRRQPLTARPCRHCCRSSQGRRSTGTPRRARLHASFDAIRTENFQIFSGPQNFSREIV